jgi:hypothetical protein
MEKRNVNVYSGSAWLIWLIVLFYNFGENKIDLYDAILQFLTKA